MSECENCKCRDDEMVMPIVINISFNDNRMDKDESTYVDNVIMEADGDEVEIEE